MVRAAASRIVAHMALILCVHDGQSSSYILQAMLWTSSKMAAGGLAGCASAMMTTSLSCFQVSGLCCGNP